jgi:hypothetical protein
MADDEFPSLVSGALKRPFDEQVAFFRQKLGRLVPTRRWTDMMREAHDSGFMVAGAAKADLLADLAAAVDRGIAEGTGLDAFRADFKAIVERNGWHDFTGSGSRAGVAWRTRTIYTTNAATSYAAGRNAQLADAGFALRVYRHNDSVRHPRPLHLSWNNVVLPADHPFWATHSPPNGWGCRCYVLGARSERGARRLGGDPEKALPQNWRTLDPRTGAPVGIDRGWDHAPGATVANTVATMAAKAVNWDRQLAVGFMRGVPEAQRDALARAYRALPSVADDARRYAERALGMRGGAAITGAEVQERRTLGLVASRDAAEIARVGDADVAGHDYVIDRHAVRHVMDSHGDPAAETARGQRAVTPADFGRLPQILNGSDAIEDGGRTSRGLPVVRFIKRIDGETFVVAMAQRRGRRSLALLSLWVRRGG